MGTRWNEHKKEALRKRAAKRPLYDAIRKYGIEHFTVETVEECSIDELSDREIYWIDKFDSYHKGYNATHGGDGKVTVDYENIYELYKQGCSAGDIQRITGCSGKTVDKILDAHNVLKYDRVRSGIDKISKMVARIDMNTYQVLEILPSATMADNKYHTGRHVGDVCNKKRKSAAGFYWVYI